jgi:hypothetical protein
VANTHACPYKFCRVIPSTCPLRIIRAASIPWITAHAVSVVLGPCIAHTWKTSALLLTADVDTPRDGKLVSIGN